MSDLKIQNAAHELHIHKGAVFEIGTGETLEDLTKTEKALAHQLIAVEAVADASDPKLVARVHAEVEAAKRSEENATKRDAEARGTALGQEFLGILQRLAATAPKAK